MNYHDWTTARLAMLFFWCSGIVAIVAIIFAIVFASVEERSGRGRERLERLREGAVEIIADGVERGVRRVRKEE